MGIPKLRHEGTLPPGIHRATLEEIRAAFGGLSTRRVELMLALEAAVKRAWKAGVRRILVDGSFVTAKPEPRDVDLVVRVDDEFARRLARRLRDARFIAERARDRNPKALDLFVAVDEEEWASWVKLFEQDVWFGKKGLVEVVR
jgi:hypothetical protein